MYDQRNVQYLLLGKDVAITTPGLINEYTDMVDGSIAVVNAQTNAAVAHGSGLTSADPLKFVVRNGTQLIYSPVWKASKVERRKIKYDVFANNQITTFGYNYATGSIGLTDLTIYEIHLDYKEWDRTGQAQYPMVKGGVFKSGVSCTQAQVAYGLHNSLYVNFKRDDWRDFCFGRTYAGAVTDPDGSDDVHYWTVKKDSQYITYDEAYAGSMPTLAVGSYLHLAGLTYIVTELTSATVVKLDVAWERPSGVVYYTELTTPTTASVTNGLKLVTLSTAHTLTAGAVVYIGIAGVYYSAKALAPTTITLDLPYRGTTSGAATITGGIAATGGNWGILAEGRNRPFEVGKKAYNKVRFDAFISDTNTIITNISTALIGSGTYEEIAQMEYFSEMNEGKMYPGDPFTKAFRNQVLTTGQYDQLILDCYNDDHTNTVGGQPVSRFQIVVALDDAAAGTHARMIALDAVIDDMFGSATPTTP